MPALFEYMVKLSLCYGIIYLFYLLFLKQSTQYTGNRFFLLAASLLAFLLPLVRIDDFIAAQDAESLAFINNIPSVNAGIESRVLVPGASPEGLLSLLLFTFMAGAAFCTVRLLVQFLSFKKIKASAVLLTDRNNLQLYHLDQDIMPFSFGKAVYINKQQHPEAELAEIIKHESVHVQQHHTVDVLMSELICILNWYNPFAWGIKHAIKQNLEFIADDIVLQTGANRKRYQYLLLKVTGYTPLSIASSLSFSSIKKRIYMMNKTKTSKKHLLKLLFILPVVIVMIVSFRNTGQVNQAENTTLNYTKEETFRLSELTYAIADPIIETIIKKEQNKSLLQPGKPFTITLIKNERDRLKSLLEKNGYNHIGNNAISFLLDSSLTNNNFSVQVNIDLKRKIAAARKNKLLPDIKTAVITGVKSGSPKEPDGNFISGKLQPANPHCVLPFSVV